MPTPFRVGGMQHSNHIISRVDCSVLRSLEPALRNNTHENPGDLLHVLVSRSRPVREGHKPKGGREPSGEVELCRGTSEPAEQRRATFRGGWGGKGTDSGEHQSISHAPDTEWETHVPGIARCEASSKRKEAGTVHRSIPPLSAGLLRDSFYALKRQASPGVDGMTWQEYETDWTTRIRDRGRKTTRPAKQRVRAIAWMCPRRKNQRLEP